MIEHPPAQHDAGWLIAVQVGIPREEQIVADRADHIERTRGSGPAPADVAA